MTTPHDDPAHPGAIESGSDAAPRTPPAPPSGDSEIYPFSDADDPAATSHASPAFAPARLSPIPDSPPHVCPGCRYSLTGLTSRRCPECGESFTLSDARFAGEGGVGTLEEAGFRQLRSLRRRFRIGVAMILIGILVPWAVHGFDHKIPLMVILSLFAPFVLPTLLYMTRSDMEWSTAVLLWGFASIMLGAWWTALAGVNWSALGGLPGI